MHMEFNKINELLDRYWNGESSLEEERLLREYFCGQEVLAEHEVFKPYFSFLKKEAEIETDQKFHLPGRPARRKVLNWLSVAAAILLLAVGVLLFNNDAEPALEARAKQGIDWKAYECENEADCLEELKQVLFLTSITLNKGEKKTLLSIKELKDINRKITRKKIKFMKYLGTSLLALFLTLSLSAQSDAISQYFDQYVEDERFTTVYVSPKNVPALRTNGL